jgi:hypothetical protein
VSKKITYQDLAGCKVPIRELFDYLMAEVLSAGGDGDCLVKCKCYDAHNLGNLFLEYIRQIWSNHPLWLLELKSANDDDGCTIWYYQESWRFTNNLEEEVPSWQQCLVII